MWTRESNRANWLAKAAVYAASKLAAAGTLFLGLPALLTNFDRYEMQEAARFLWLGGALQGYATVFSIAVDGALLKMKAGPAKRFVTLLLYILGGFVPFLFMFGQEWGIIAIAGFIGVACSLAYLLADRLYRHARWPYSVTAAILLAAGSLYIAFADQTTVRGWSETRSDQGVEAAFDYFHGDKAYPVKLEAGQTLAYYVEWHAEGGYGTHLNAKGGKYGGDGLDREPRRIAYQVGKATTIDIVVTGKRARGSFAIHWDIMNKDAP
jgi:hypothetical protein